MPPPDDYKLQLCTYLSSSNLSFSFQFPFQERPVDLDCLVRSVCICEERNPLLVSSSSSSSKITMTTIKKKKSLKGTRSSIKTFASMLKTFDLGDTTAAAATDAYSFFAVLKKEKLKESEREKALTSEIPSEAVARARWNLLSLLKTLCSYEVRHVMSYLYKSHMFMREARNTIQPFPNLLKSLGSVSNNLLDLVHVAHVIIEDMETFLQRSQSALAGSSLFENVAPSDRVVWTFIGVLDSLQDLLLFSAQAMLRAQKQRKCMHLIRGIEPFLDLDESRADVVQHLRREKVLFAEIGKDGIAEGIAEDGGDTHAPSFSSKKRRQEDFFFDKDDDDDNFLGTEEEKQENVQMDLEAFFDSGPSLDELDDQQEEELFSQNNNKKTPQIKIQKVVHEQQQQQQKQKQQQEKKNKKDAADGENKIPKDQNDLDRILLRHSLTARKLQALSFVVESVWHDAIGFFKCANCGLSGLFEDDKKQEKNKRECRGVCSRCHVMTCYLCEKIIPFGPDQVEHVTGIAHSSVHVIDDGLVPEDVVDDCFHPLLSFSFSSSFFSNNQDCGAFHHQSSSTGYDFDYKDDANWIVALARSRLESFEACSIDTRAFSLINGSLSDLLFFNSSSSNNNNNNNNDNKNKDTGNKIGVKNKRVKLGASLTDLGGVFGLKKGTPNDEKKEKDIKKQRGEDHKKRCCPVLFSDYLFSSTPPLFWQNVFDDEKEKEKKEKKEQQRVYGKALAHARKVYQRLSALIFLIGSENFQKVVAYMCSPEVQSSRTLHAMDALVVWATVLDYQLVPKRTCDPKLFTFVDHINKNKNKEEEKETKRVGIETLRSALSELDLSQQKKEKAQDHLFPLPQFSEITWDEYISEREWAETIKNFSFNNNNGSLLAHFNRAMTISRKDEAEAVCDIVLRHPVTQPMFFF